MILCTICARGGSKGVASKNIRPLLGRPLIAHTLQQAKDSGCFDAIAVSSDSAAILDVALKHGAHELIERPPELATDTAPKVPAIQHCVRAFEERRGCHVDFVVDLDASAPLRQAVHIREALKLLRTSEADNVITAVPARRSPYFNLVELDPTGWARLSKTLPSGGPVRRQDGPKCFDMNASIYGWRRDTLLGGSSVFLPKTALYVMPEETVYDIDSEFDFQLVEFLLQHKRSKTHR
jgi:CMP-N,N'-diacetyllegionaminic acid synthase